MKQQSFTQGYMALLAAFPLAKVSDETQQVYWQMLKDIPDQEWNDGLKKCLATARFFPSINELGTACIGEEKEHDACDPWRTRQHYREGRNADWRTLLNERLAEERRPKLPEPAPVYKLSAPVKEPYRPVFDADAYLARIHNKLRGDSGFLQKRTTVVKVSCVQCGAGLLLPFADGTEKFAICEECNR